MAKSKRTFSVRVSSFMKIWLEITKLDQTNSIFSIHRVRNQESWALSKHKFPEIERNFMTLKCHNVCSNKDIRMK